VDLRDEEREIYAEFPELRGMVGGNGATRQRATKRRLRAEGSQSSLPESGKRRKRKPMTAAQRKAVGVRMKKYWAARRKAKNT